MTQAIAIIQRYRAHLAVVVVNSVFAIVFVTIALTGFHQPTPHNLPVGIVAPAPMAHQLEAGLADKLPGGFAVRPLAGEAQARAAIHRRQIDGAVVVAPSGIHLLTAEAGGNAPTQAITAAFTALAAKTGQPLTTSDVVPPSRDDSEALSSFFLILCVLFPSLATGIVVGHGLRRTSLLARLVVLVSVASIVGLAAAAIGDGISGLGHYWALAGIVGLFSLAVSAPTAALGQIRPHLASLCVLAFLIFGIPVSGGPSNLTAFGPQFVRSLHSGLPLGAAADAARNVAYFGAADTANHIAVLSVYAVAGLCVLALVVTLTGRRRPRPEAAEEASPRRRPAAPTQRQRQLAARNASGRSGEAAESARIAPSASRSAP
jgi:nitrate reductase NapE component